MALLGAIDQGTSSTRFIVFDDASRIVALAQMEHAQIYPQPGWVEHDPLEIWRNTEAVVAQAMRSAQLQPKDLAAIGITNQRETTVVSRWLVIPSAARSWGCSCADRMASAITVSVLRQISSG